MKEVLDTRFFTNHYGSRDAETIERTRAKLSQLRRERRGLVPAVVLAEVAHFLCVEAGRKRAMAEVRAIEDSGPEIVPLDSPIAREAGILKCIHRTLPLVDCVIAATAIRVRGRVVSDAPHFGRIDGLRVTWI